MQYSSRGARYSRYSTTTTAARRRTVIALILTPPRPISRAARGAMRDDRETAARDAGTTPGEKNAHTGGRQRNDRRVPLNGIQRPPRARARSAAPSGDLTSPCDIASLADPADGSASVYLPSPRPPLRSDRPRRHRQYSSRTNGDPPRTRYTESRINENSPIYRRKERETDRRRLTKASREPFADISTSSSRR